MTGNRIGPIRDVRKISYRYRISENIRYFPGNSFMNLLDYISRMIVRSRYQIQTRTQVGQPSRSHSGEDKLVATLLFGTSRATAQIGGPHSHSALGTGRSTLTCSVWADSASYMRSCGKLVDALHEVGWRR